jgi:hypothetical protein
MVIKTHKTDTSLSGYRTTNVLKHIVLIFITSTLASSFLYLADYLLPNTEYRMHGINTAYMVILTVLFVIFKKYLNSKEQAMPLNDRLLLLIILIINFIISTKLLSAEYLMNTLDFNSHANFVMLIKGFEQPFLGTNVGYGQRPFYPLGSLYQFSFISSLVNISSIEILRGTYVLIAALIWPIILWQYIQSYNISRISRTKIFIVGLTFNHMPYGYFYWGHLPTVISVLVAMWLEMRFAKSEMTKFKYFVLYLIATITLLQIHPVGVGTLIGLRIIRWSLETDRPRIKTIKDAKKGLFIGILLTLGFFINVKFNFVYESINYQIIQNYEKLLNGTTFQYNINLWERFNNFMYKWLIQLKYIEFPSLDLLFMLLIVGIIIMGKSVKYLVIILAQIMLIASTAASQQIFPISLLAMPTFLFYSSPSRISHLTIIILILVLGKTLDAISTKNIIYKILTHQFTWVIFLVIFNWHFYLNI